MKAGHANRAGAARSAPIPISIIRSSRTKAPWSFTCFAPQLGDDAFTALLRDFYKQHAGKTATIDEFEKLAAANSAAKPGDPAVNLVSFFSQWLNSTGVPEFSLDYIVYRTPEGLPRGRQDSSGSGYVPHAGGSEGRYRRKSRIQEGSRHRHDLRFKIETFGRPKPNGITIDPNNNLLKSSPHLRVRASVARGEALAHRRQILRGDSGISARAGCAAHGLARALPHGRSDVLSEELPGGRQRVPLGAGRRSESRSGWKSGATFTSARFTICSASANAP